MSTDARRVEEIRRTFRQHLEEGGHCDGVCEIEVHSWTRDLLAHIDAINKGLALCQMERSDHAERLRDREEELRGYMMANNTLAERLHKIEERHSHFEDLAAERTRLLDQVEQRLHEAERARDAQHTRATLHSAGFKETARQLEQARKTLREIGERAIVDWQDELVGLVSVGLGTADWDSVVTMEKHVVRDEQALRYAVQDKLAQAEQRVATLEDVLEWLDRRGGLGLDVHERIRAALMPAPKEGK